MATILKVKRVSGNPRRKRMTAKQLRYFGTKRQRRAVANRRRRRNLDAYTDAAGYVHPIRGTTGYSRKSAHEKTGKRKRRKNSALVVTLGAAPGLAGLNPRRKRRNKVARARRTASGRFTPRRRRRSNRKRYDNRRRYDNPRRRRRTNRRRTDNRRRYDNAPRRRRRNRRRYDNPRRRSYNRRRRVYNRRRRSANRRYARRRNPGIMGMPITSKGALKLIGGGLLGVAAVKFVPKLIPANLIPGGGSPYVTVLVTGVSAILVGWLIGKMDRELGDGATFGGLMVAGSQLINTIAPGLSIGGVPIGGLGDLMPGSFVVPQNPLRLPPPPPQPAGGARVTMSGLARAYGSAF